MPFMLLKPCVNLLQPIVDGMAFQQVFLQHTIRPAAKKCSIPAVHTIADRKDGIKIIKFCDILLFSIVTHMFQNGTCAFLVKFTTVVNVVQMFGNSRTLCPE